MPSPLQERVYELLVRVGTVHIDGRDDWRRERLSRLLFRDTTELASCLEGALGSPNRDTFRANLYEANVYVRQVKLWLRLLDDVGGVEPDACSPMHSVAEEVHSLVLAALKTSGHRLQHVA
ncbi:MAG: hypothetical protein ACO3QO_04115 [Candidatus Kapaibacteriota bacterium]|jgi:hypothetical protein